MAGLARYERITEYATAGTEMNVHLRLQQGKVRQMHVHLHHLHANVHLTLLQMNVQTVLHLHI